MSNTRVIGHAGPYLYLWALTIIFLFLVAPLLVFGGVDGIVTYFVMERQLYSPVAILIIAQAYFAYLIFPIVVSAFRSGTILLLEDEHLVYGFSWYWSVPAKNVKSIELFTNYGIINTTITRLTLLDGSIKYLPINLMVETLSEIKSILREQVLKDLK